MPIPDLPATAGEAGSVEFDKDGASYRIVRIDEDTLVIHRRGFSREQFELVLSNFTANGAMFDVQGMGTAGPVIGLGSNRGILARLF